MSEPQVTMTGPVRLLALAADLELIRADMEAFDLRKLAALWEADLERAANDNALLEESFVQMRAKRDDVLRELQTTQAALERARALVEKWRREEYNELMIFQLAAVLENQ